MLMCVVADCGLVDAPRNGRFTAPSTTDGSIGTYSCNNRFVLCGVENVTCQSNGSWTGPPPECISKENNIILL